MSSAPTHFDSVAFWHRLALRLAPVLGDIETKLGDRWMDRFESCFSFVDFEAFDLARAQRPPASYVLTLLEAADPLTEVVDPLQASYTEAGAVALLLDLCKSRALWPTRVEGDADGIAFWRERMPFATVHRLGPSPALPPAVRQRAQSLLGGLRKHGDVAGEFHRRMARWPGLASLLPTTEAQRRRREYVHWPCPAEWLIGARRLWQLLGVSNADTAMAQALAAAVFGIENWHQLCAVMPKGSTDADWWANFGPFLVEAYDTPDDTPAVHPDPLAAFVDFAGRAQRACAGPDRFTCDISDGLVLHMPYLTVRTARRADESEEAHFQREYVSPRLSLSPMMREQPSDASVTQVLAPLERRDWTALLACFRLEPEDDVWPNRIFHTVQFEKVQCHGVVTRGGPYVMVGDDGAPVGVCTLRKFHAGESDFQGAVPAGWWLMKYERDRKCDLTSLSDQEARRLATAFGLPLLAEPTADLPDAQLAFNRATASRAFYRSSAWVSLRLWCRAHPGIAKNTEEISEYLPEWFRKAMAE